VGVYSLEKIVPRSSTWKGNNRWASCKGSHFFQRHKSYKINNRI